MKNLYTTLLLICFICCSTLYAQQKAEITGHVRTSDGQAAESVTVRIQGSNRQVVTDQSGYFSIKGLTPGNYTLHVSSVGLSSVDKSVHLDEGESSSVDLTLNENASTLQEVTITAAQQQLVAKQSDYVAKMPLSRMENAQVYTTVTRQVMDQQVALTVDDVLKNVPGVTKLWDAVGRAGTGGSFFISRGFNVQPKLRNGMSGNIATTIDPVNLEMLEAIKGPSATLYGSSLISYGGLFNRVTKKPYDHFGGAVTYTGGSFGLSRLTADINTPLNQEGTVLFRVNGAYHKENSWQDYGYRESFTVAPSLQYKVNDRLSFLFDAEIMSNEQVGMAQMIYFVAPSTINPLIASTLASSNLDQATISAIMAGAPKTMKEAFGTDRADELPIDYNRSFLSNDVINRSKAANFFAQMDYKLSDQWKSQTYISQTNSSSNGDTPYFELLPNYLAAFIGSIGSGVPSFGTPGADQMARMSWRPVGNDHSLEIQQNFIGDFHIGNLRNRLTAGLDYYDYDYNLTYHRFNGSILGVPFTDAFDVVSTSGTVANYGHLSKGKLDSAYAASPSGGFESHTKNRVYSAYASDVLNLMDNLILSAALRVDHFDNKGNFDKTTGEYTGGYNQTTLAPKFGLVYQPIREALSFFGNYQSGFTNQTGVDANGEPFKPEHAYQWEGGLKTDLFDGKLAATVSYYDIKVKDIVRADVAHPGFSIQDGTQKSSGVEAEVIASPAIGFTILAGYGYNKNVLEDADANVEGLRPVASGPKNSANFWLHYRFSHRVLKGFGLGFGGNYAGEAFAVNNHSDGSLILPSYTIFNAAISYDQPKFAVTLKMNNLSDKKYWIGWTTMSPQMPRQVLAAISYRF